MKFNKIILGIKDAPYKPKAKAVKKKKSVKKSKTIELKDFNADDLNESVDS